MNPALTDILDKAEPYRSILIFLKDLVERQVPEAELKFKWKIPYFYLKGKPYVYLYATRNYVDMGFAKGFQLKENSDLLIKEKRNTIASLRFFPDTEIDTQMVIKSLEEAKRLYISSC